MVGWLVGWLVGSWSVGRTHHALPNQATTLPVTRSPPPPGPPPQAIALSLALEAEQRRMNASLRAGDVAHSAPDGGFPKTLYNPNALTPARR